MFENNEITELFKSIGNEPTSTDKVLSKKQFSEIVSELHSAEKIDFPFAKGAFVTLEQKTILRHLVDRLARKFMSMDDNVTRLTLVDYPPSV